MRVAQAVLIFKKFTILFYSDANMNVTSFPGSDLKPNFWTNLRFLNAEGHCLQCSLTYYI